MNYRHAFHAGNFADVVKHALLARIIEYLKLKEKAFRVVDTHAGEGLYHLASSQSERTGEWRDGIGKLMARQPEGEAGALLAPYLSAVTAVNASGGLSHYPGSPLIVRHLLRKQDRLTAIELHPQDSKRLEQHLGGDHQVRVIELDGWLALGAHLPPKEKRGLVLVDPPFEAEGEFDRLIDGLVRAHRRWPGGIYALWYPIKHREALVAMVRAVRASAIPNVLDIRFMIRPASAQEPRLDGSGMLVVNPPWTLQRELSVMLPFLREVLGQAGGADWSVDWLAKEAARTAS